MSMMRKNQFIVGGLGIAILLWLLYAIGALSSGYALSLRLTDSLLSPVTESVLSFRKSISFLGNLQSLAAENELLTKRVQEIELNERKIDELQAEVRWLRGQLDLALPKRVTSGTIGKVLPLRSGLVPGYIYLDLSGNNVEKGSFAVLNDYIVGEVVDSYDGFAKVRLLVSSDTSMGVEIDKGIIGTLKGVAGTRLIIEGVPVTRGLAEGSNVRLLNNDNLNLSAFSLGKVSKITETSASSTYEIEVVSPVQWDSLEFITISK